MKKAALFTCIALTGAVIANDSTTLTTRPALQNTNQMRVSAEALLWRTEQGGTEWAYDETDAGVTTYKDVNFGWNWGFRVAAGIDINQDQWDTTLAYTWFRAEKNSKAAQPGGVSSVIGADFGNDSAAAKWHVEYNGLDWNLGGNYMVKTQLSLRPHAGVKFGWINQNMRQSFVNTDATTDSIHGKSKFFGVGPSAGVASNWNFAEGFNLFGDLSSALMWGNFNIHQHGYSDIDDAVVTSRNLSRNYVAPMISTILGFGWATNFNDDAARFTVNLGYELQYWFRQNQFMNTNTNTRLSQDLAFQGGTLEFRFDF